MEKIKYRAIEFPNSAGRLRMLLVDAKQVSSDITTYEAWQRVFSNGLPSIPADGALVAWESVMSNLLSALDEVAATEADIRLAKPDQAFVYVEDFGELRKIFASYELMAPFGNVQRHITDKLLADLRYCAMALPEEDPDEEDLGYIYEEVEGLFDHIRGISAPVAIKKWMMELLDKILQAIRHYWIHGSRGLRKALANLVGEVEVNGAAISEINVHSFSENLKQVAKHIMEYCETADAPLSIAVSTVALLDRFGGSLPGLPGT